MGWGRMLLLGDWGQQWDIEDQKKEIENLRQEINSGAAAQEVLPLKARIAHLEKENGELRLYLAALVRYLGHKGAILKEDFQHLVETIDVEDGQADGGYTGKIIR